MVDLLQSTDQYKYEILNAGYKSGGSRILTDIDLVILNLDLYKMVNPSRPGVFRTEFGSAAARDKVANPVEFAGGAVGMIMPRKHGPHTRFLEQRV